MRIADQIALVAQEFVAGDELLAAVVRQEGVTSIQAASWFLRHIDQLNALPMVAFNKQRNDFRHIDRPWASDVFFEMTSAEPSPAEWDESGNGYIGGWLSSHLKKFFDGAGLPYPLDRDSSDDAQFQLASQPGQVQGAAASLQNFLTDHGQDLTRMSSWLESFGSDYRRTAIALRIGIEKVVGFPPLYSNDESSGTAAAIDYAPASDIWSAVLACMLREELPDIVTLEGDEFWVDDFYVRDADCAEFLAGSGLPMGSLVGLTGGSIEPGGIDIEAAIARLQATPTPMRLPGSSATQSKPASDPPESALSGRERDSLLRMIGALLGFIAGEIPTARRHPDMSTEAELIRLIDQHFDGFEGLSASNMSRKFPLAKRLLRN